MSIAKVPAVSDYTVVHGRANHVWLVLEKEDPFVSGGTPGYATRDEQAAWDWLAERVALEGWERWRFDRTHGYPRATLWESMANEAAGWELAEIEVALPAREQDLYDPERRVWYRGVAEKTTTYYDRSRSQWVTVKALPSTD